MDDKTVVLDLGSYSVKAGFGGEIYPRQCMWNFISKGKRDRKKFVGDQANDSPDYIIEGGFEDGLLVNFDAQTDVFERLFDKSNLNIMIGSNADQVSVTALNAKECSIIITEPLHCPNSIRANINQVVFEEWGFSRLTLLPAQSFIPHALDTVVPIFDCTGSRRKLSEDVPHRTFIDGVEQSQYKASSTGFVPFNQNPCALIVDIGHSATTIVPLLEFSPLLSAVQRCSIGGIAMANFMAKLLSSKYPSIGDRYLNSHILVETCCLVSQSFDAQMQRCSDQMTYASQRLKANIDFRKHNNLTDLFIAEVVPAPKDADSKKTVKKTKTVFEMIAKEARDEDVEEEDLESLESRTVKLNTERIIVPECLFRPPDAGIAELGIVAAAVRAIQKCPVELQPLIASNIILAGGGACIPGLAERFSAEIRSRLDAALSVNVRLEKHSNLSAWRGASKFSMLSERFAINSITKQHYYEVNR